MFNFGDIILVKAFPNLTLERRVVMVKEGETVFVCNESEYQSALKAHREPASIGFPINDVVECKNETENRQTA